MTRSSATRKSDQSARQQSGPQPAVHFVKPEEWATANRHGIELVRTWLRRENDPLPHTRKGSDYLVDDELAVAWVRRHFGVNCDVSE